MTVINKLSRTQAQELLKAFLIVTTYLDEQREALIDQIRSTQITELAGMLDLPDIELIH